MKYKFIDIGNYRGELEVFNKSIEVVEGNSKKEVLKNRFEREDIRELLRVWGDEFVYNVGEYIGVNEEEGIICIGENEELYNIVDKDMEEWSDSDWEKLESYVGEGLYNVIEE